MSNLVEHLDKFTGLEKKCLVGVLNKYYDGGATVTLGSLPFINYMKAREAVRKAISSADEKVSVRTLETWQSCESKLSLKEVNGVSRFVIYLDPNRVQKWSKKVKLNKKVGYEIGVPYKVIREVSTQWQEFGKRWVRPKESIQVVVEVRQLQGDLHEVHCPTSLHDPVKGFLFERYGPTYG